MSRDSELPHWTDEVVAKKDWEDDGIPWDRERWLELRAELIAEEDAMIKWREAHPRENV